MRPRSSSFPEFTYTPSMDTPSRSEVDFSINGSLDPAFHPSEDEDARSEGGFSINGSLDSAFHPSEDEDARSEGEPMVSSDGVGEDEDQMVPDAPPCSEEEEDEVDGLMSSVIFDTIKSAVYHLLNMILGDYREEQCYGCKVNHPSQKQHACLEVLEDNFFQDHYHHLMKRLITSRFIPSIQHLLVTRRITLDNTVVRTVAETLLYELKPVKHICTEIAEVYDNLTGEDPVKIKQLHAVSCCYTG